MKIPPITGSCLSFYRGRRAHLFSLILIVFGVGSLILVPSALTMSRVISTVLNVFSSPAAPQSQTTTFYLHGTGPVDNPPALFLDTTAATATSAKYRDSASISRNNGNTWKEIGNWSAAASMTTGEIASLGDLHVWLGLKNSDDQGTNFDLRVEAYRNGTMITSGQSLCIAGVTRNPANAKEVVLAFDPFTTTSFNGSSDVLRLRLLTRVGTNATGDSCGGHSNAAGLRLYFDAVTRSSRFNLTSGVADTTGPILDIESPEDGTYTSANQIQISGTFSDAVSITVNGIAPTINGSHFSATVVLPTEGVNTITVLASDAAGNQSELFHTVKRDTTAPAISLSHPVEGEVFRTVLTSGNITDASPVTVTIDGTRVPIEDGFFEQKAQAPEGARQVRVVATDAAGNTSEVVRSTTIDLTAPLFSNITPAEGAPSNSPATITGHITDASAVTVKVTDTDAVVNANGDFTANNISLANGENQLLLTATDAAGNQNDLTLTLIGPDRTPPGAPFVFPVVSPTRLMTATVEGRAEPGSTVVISGGTEPVTADAAFGTGVFAANVNLNAGLNSLSLVARDAAGNASPSTQVSITSDPNLALPPAGQPSQINISTGNAQKGLVNTALPRPLIGIITDRDGAPVANVTVRFTMQAGGGRFTSGNDFADAATDAHGYASATYTSGPTAGLQQIRADFSGNTVTPAVFVAEALEPAGTETTVSGIVLDQNLRALPNVLVRIGGQQTRTGADGRFRVLNVTSGPHQVLELIGRDQITLPGRWPNISHDFDVLPGVNNDLGRPLFLPKVNAGIAMPLDANNVVTQDTTFELPVVGGQPPIRITAKAGTRVLFPPDVTDKTLSVTRIAPNRVPMSLEDGRATNLYISVQPSGTVFETPLEVSYPNLDGLPANKQVLLMSFDHDAGRYVTVGTGHVTADGREVRSDPGSGIRVGAWHAGPPPDPQPEVTVISHIQIDGNPAFEDKTITSIDAWVDGVRAVPAPNPALGSIEGVSRIELKATLTLPEGTPRVTHVESVVAAEEKLKIKFDANDERFAPTVERFNFKYSITAPAATPAQVAKLEIFKTGDLNNPIFVDTLQTTANKLDYSQGGQPGWDGKINQPAGVDKYIEPKDGPFTVRISAATKADLSDLIKVEKTLKVEIHSFTFTPDDDFKSFKPTRNATEVDNPIEVTMKVKNKAGNGVVTALPFKIKWSFEDPDDTAGGGVDLNGGAPDDNIEVRLGGKKADTVGANPLPGKIMWKTVSNFTAQVSADGQSVDAEVTTTAGADQGKSKLTFSTSVIAGDNYRLVAKYLKDDNVTVVKEDKSGKWSVWKRLDFQNAYRMNGGADVDAIMDRANINPAFNGDGYTDYNLGNVTRLARGPASPEFVSSTILPPNAQESPSPNETQAQINTKAQAWFDRNRANINQEFANYIQANNIPRFSVIGGRYYHPKYDNNPGTGGPGLWQSGTRINTADPGAAANSIDPDGEWGNVQGSEGGEIAFIFLNIVSIDRSIVVGRHEVGHASDHVLFDAPANPPGDHATSGLMHPNADQSFTNPFGVGTFSNDSIRKLRGIKP